MVVRPLFLAHWFVGWGVSGWWVGRGCHVASGEAAGNDRWLATFYFWWVVAFGEWLGFDDSF